MMSVVMSVDPRLEGSEVNLGLIVITCICDCSSILFHLASSKSFSADWLQEVIIW